MTKYTILPSEVDIVDLRIGICLAEISGLKYIIENEVNLHIDDKPDFLNIVKHKLNAYEKYLDALQDLRHIYLTGYPE